jgi:hypothetical protein
MKAYQEMNAQQPYVSVAIYSDPNYMDNTHSRSPLTLQMAQNIAT